ncbi:hypothetical protein AAVH_09802 [Aphelenchoides avenae]|nr:hypothetical protein AAVH_09802 [Aphelenchus avenae]
MGHILLGCEAARVRRVHAERGLRRAPHQAPACWPVARGTEEGTPNGVVSVVENKPAREDAMAGGRRGLIANAGNRGEFRALAKIERPSMGFWLI